MELTISQIGSASPHWVARSIPAANMGVRPVGANVAKPADSVPATPVAALGDMETEYDQFGRFGAPAPEAPDPSADNRSGINATKYFRSGQVTVSELDQEYARSLLATTIGPEKGNGGRRFIPSGMTEYQVYQLYDFQYRWAIEVERRAIARMQDAERPHPAIRDVESTSATPGGSLQR